MKKNMDVGTFKGLFNRSYMGLAGLAVTLALGPGAAQAAPGPSGIAKTYIQTNLVSDLNGMAQMQDDDLVNPWGISFGPTQEFWISDNGSGLSTLYTVGNDSHGVPTVEKEGLVVIIPGEGVPTGQLFNNTGAFNDDIFIFAGEDGTISGWRGELGDTAEILATRPGAIYKGITLDKSTGVPLLLLANFAEGTLDVYDTNFNLTQFSDTKAPHGYAPFNVKSLANKIIVTFAMQDADKEDDVQGIGHGLIDTFSLKTHKFTKFAAGSAAGGHIREIDSPWGISMAPKGFGVRRDELLIGNFGSGTIMAFNVNGNLDGLLTDGKRRPITIDGLWGLEVGNGGEAGVTTALYFTAGLNGENDGLFGSLVPAPSNPGRH